MSFCCRNSFILAVLALAASGCGSVAGVQDVVVDFQVVAKSNGTFFRWNEITTAVDTTSVDRATLLAVTLDVQAPEGTPDLTFLKSVTGEAVNSEKRTLVVAAESFPKGEQAVILDVKYHDDLRPLFKDPNTLRIEWNGQINTAYTGWPADGFSVRGRIKVDIE
jgi:hypothetical protein